MAIARAFLEADRAGHFEPGWAGTGGPAADGIRGGGGPGVGCAGPRSAVLRGPGEARPRTGGRVGILTAGTSDIPVAEEAALICREMGCEVYTAYDVGVAGIHRLVEPLRYLLDEVRVDVLIVAAGMDGAPPQSPQGWRTCPSSGFPPRWGTAWRGWDRRASTLCSRPAPGLAVVNIDNGVGAGAIAGLIANRAAAARKGPPPPQPNPNPQSLIPNPQSQSQSQSHL